MFIENEHWQTFWWYKCLNKQGLISSTSKILTELTYKNAAFKNANKTCTSGGWRLLYIWQKSANEYRGLVKPAKMSSYNCHQTHFCNFETDCVRQAYPLAIVCLVIWNTFLILIFLILPDMKVIRTFRVANRLKMQRLPGDSFKIIVITLKTILDKNVTHMRWISWLEKHSVRSMHWLRLTKFHLYLIHFKMLHDVSL